ncbi:MAG: hypothetical protein JNG83_00365 [Opitutaceae bacterium]|nr:hypothetical protein [Opitutaceae bacterium]
MPETSAEIYLSDMSRCEPASLLSRERRRGHWRLIDYETPETKGTMVFAVPGEGTPAITLPVDVRGCYRVYVGINYSRFDSGDHLHNLPWPLYGQVQLRFDDEPGYSRFAYEGGWDGELVEAKVARSIKVYTSIQETLWRVRDFDGPTRLHLSPMTEPYSDIAGSRLANLSYLRLVPVTGDELAAWRRLRPRPETRNLAMLWCAGMISGHAMGSPMYHPTNRQWFRDEIAPFVGTDIGTFVFEAIRGNLAMFPTQVGDTGAPDGGWDPSWVNPLAAFRDLAREHGMRIFAAMRMMGPGYPMIDVPIARGRFYWEHPQWAKCDRDGAATNNVSLAFPGVRAHWAALAREALDHGIDGLVLYLHRCQPFVLFEQPVVDDFRRLYGEDARQVPMEDERLRRLWAGYVTQFLRELRALVDERPGRQLGVCFYGAPYKFDTDDAYDPLRYNCDVDAWLREGLVDILMPTPSASPAAIARWRTLGGARVRIWPDLMPRMQPGADCARRAREFYAAGADGLCFWDGERRPPHVSEWSVMSRLGHRDDLDFLEREAPGFYRFYPLTKLWNFSVRFSFKDG